MLTPDGWESARFQAVCAAEAGFHQKGVVSSRPPAGNAHRWAFSHSETIQEVIVEDQKDEQKDPEETAQVQSSSPSLSDNLSRKYPYLTAYIGFLALFVFFGIVVGLILIVPQFIFSSIVDAEMFSPFTELFVTIFRIVVGFYAFKYVVKKHILP